MKKFLLTIGFLFALATVGNAQSQCVDVEEIDGSPRAPCIRELKVTNGTLNCPTVNRCVLTISGGGGGSPGGLSGQVQWNDTGSFNGTSGLTATATTITIVSGVSATFSNTSPLISATNSADSASVQIAIWQGDRATVAGNDEAYFTLRLSDDGGGQTEVARLTWAIPTATAAAEDGRLDFSVMTGGTLAKELQLAGADLSPSTNDGLALGTASLMWSDLFLASGAAINFNGGNVVLTHSAGILTMGTGELRITTVGTNTASVPTLGSTSTFTNKTITASSNVLGGVTMTLGSDADGDIYYRASNVLTRLPKGTAGQVLTMNGGATAPEWAAAASSGITVGTTTVTSGTNTRVLYNNSGVVGEYVITGTGNVMMSASPTTTGRLTGADANFATAVTTGTGSTAGFEITANSLTTGNGHEISSSSVSSGNVVSIAATGTAAASNTKTALFISTSGANATSTQTTYGARISNTSTGTSSSNIALSLAASGGSTNLALLVPSSPTIPAISGVVGTTGIGFNGGEFAVIRSGATAALFSSVGWYVNAGYQFGIGSGGTAAGFAAKGATGLRLSNFSTGAGNLLIGTSTVGDFGTSCAGCLAIANGTAPTSSPADEFQLYSADSAAGDANAFIRNEGGEINRISGLAARNSSSFAKTSDTTLANITGLTRNVEASRVYYFETELSTTSANTGGVKFAISGTATATSIDYEGVLRDGTTISAATRATALDTTVCAVTAVTAATCRIRGVIVVNAAGTLTVQFAQNASDAGASTVLVNQALTLKPIS